MQPFGFLGFGVTIVPLAVLVLVIVLIVGGRREPDPEQQRPAAIYYALVQFVTVFVVLFALFAMASSLLNLTTSDSASSDRIFSDFSVGPTFAGPGGRPVIVGGDGTLNGGVLREHGSRSQHDQDWADAVRAFIVVLVAGAIFAFHERRRPRFPPGTPGHRVWKTYLYAVSFVAVLTTVGALTGALFKVWEGIAPGITGDGPRSHAFRDAGSVAFLALTAGLVFWRHLSWAEPPRGREAAAPPPAWRPPAEPAAFAPVAPAPPPRPPAPRPRPPVTKRAPAKRTPPPRKRSAD
jgi:hypothetical protein